MRIHREAAAAAPFTSLSLCVVTGRQEVWGGHSRVVFSVIPPGQRDANEDTKRISRAVRKSLCWKLGALHGLAQSSSLNSPNSQTLPWDSPRADPPPHFIPQHRQDIDGSQLPLHGALQLPRAWFVCFQQDSFVYSTLDSLYWARRDKRWVMALVNKITLLIFFPNTWNIIDGSGMGPILRHRAHVSPQLLVLHPKWGLGGA